MNLSKRTKVFSSFFQIHPYFLFYFLPILIVLFFGLTLLTEYFFSGRIWIQGYIPIYFGQLDSHFSPYSAWWGNLGIGEYPFFFNILLYVPIRFLLLVFNGYLSWIFYVLLLFYIGAILFAFYIKYLLKQLSPTVSCLLGVLYISFIGLNREINYFTLKICSVFLPLSLLLFLVSYDSLRKKIFGFREILYLILFSVLILDYVIFDPRSIIAFVVIIISHIVFLYLRDRNRTDIIKAITWLLVGIVGGVILYYPIKYPQAISYLYSGQLAAATPSSIVTSVGFFMLLLHSNPIFHPTLPVLAGIVQLVVGVFLSFINLKKSTKDVYFFSILLFIGYLIFTERSILTILTVHFPYGQLFRTWEIGQYIANFFIVIVFAGIFINKRFTLFKKFLVIVICLYVLSSIVDFNQQLVFVNKGEVDRYKNINKFLIDDKDDFKVLWLPEMSWYGDKTQPFWLNNENASTQDFVEFASAKPTYLHYFTPMTHVYTWLASGEWSSELMHNKQSANLLNILGVKYAIIHLDVPGYNRNAEIILSQLLHNKDFELVKRDKYLYVFKNLRYKSRVWGVTAQNTSFCDSGLYCLGQYFSNNSTYNTALFLTDQLVLPQITQNVKNIYFSLPDHDFNNLIINKLLQIKDQRSSILFAKDFTQDLSSIGCLSDTHQGEYHTLFSQTGTYDYANTFEFGNCFFILQKSQSQTILPFNLKKGKYVMLTRYLVQKDGDSFTISSPFFNFSYPTKAKEGLNYYRYTEHTISIPSDSDVPLALSNGTSTSSISVIAFIPKDLYQEENRHFKENLSIIGSTPKPQENVSITNLRENNSSEWELDVTNSSPFILKFAEAYNPLWGATIRNGNNKVSVSST